MVNAENQQMPEAIGFAGIASLVTVLDKAEQPPDTEKPSPPQSRSRSESSGNETRIPVATPPPSLAHRPNPSPYPLKSDLGWLFIGLVILGVVMWFSTTLQQPPSPSPNRVTPTSHVATASSHPAPKPIEPKLNTRPVEAIPPVGAGLLLTDEQIHYCLAENYRIEGVRAISQGLIQSEVRRFNQFVDDYNSRCSNFRYHTGSLERAKRVIDPFKKDLEAEGRIRLQISHPTPVAKPSPPPEPSLSPKQLVQTIQRKLNDLGYKAGAVDGLVGKGTRSAIIAFQKANGLVATGVADQSLLVQPQHAPVRAAARQPERPQLNTSEPATSVKTASTESVCISEKYLGPGAYRACLARQKASPSVSPRKPDLSSLSTEERGSIENVCYPKKQFDGPASYYQCLGQQLAALSRSHGKPDLSRLSAEERGSIENVCYPKKQFDGPASYYQCLGQQLAALSRSHGKPDMSRLSAEERGSIENVCYSKKQFDGPASYYQCLGQQLAALSRSHGKPDMSRLSAEERGSIENVCYSKKQFDGPASYYQCLGQQLAALSRSHGKPDMSRLSAEERGSIENVCYSKKQFNGPASYYQCLGQQLAALQK